MQAISWLRCERLSGRIFSTASNRLIFNTIAYEIQKTAKLKTKIT